MEQGAESNELALCHIQDFYAKQQSRFNHNKMTKLANSDDLIQFKNCQLIRDHKIVTLDLWVRRGKIVDPEKVFFDEQKYSSRTVDCGGALLAPGFIDLQINGKATCLAHCVISHHSDSLIWHHL